MAVDEVLFRSALEAPEEATVRLYGFRPPTVSYGYRQRLQDAVDPEACRAQGVEWVRRPTGGRALLHQHEITYSVAAPIRGPLVGLSVRQVYEFVNGALRRALVELGIPIDGHAPAVRKRSTEPPIALPCLSLPERHEITSGGKKLVASAQRRNRRAFLQHGIVLFRVDERLWRRIAPPGSAATLEAVGIEDLTPKPLTRTDVANALRSAFEEAFDGTAVPGELSAAEKSLVSSLWTQYRSEEWNRQLKAG